MRRINDLLISFFLDHTSLMNCLGTLLMKAHLMYLNYPVNPKPRYGYGKPPHPELERIISTNEAAYADILNGLSKYREHYLQIPKYALKKDPTNPSWINNGIGPFDAMQIYGFLCMFDPRRYYEIGSGASTTFARRAITDHGLRTRILSFGPNPRYEIDKICDYCCRQPIEEADISLFDELDEGDVLFVDDGHRVFENQGPTVFFLDIFARLKKGVIVGIHDIFLPYDYPPEWIRLYYSEQYLLAAYLLSNENRYEILLPCRYIAETPTLRKMISGIWAEIGIRDAELFGTSFWIRIR